MGKLSGAVVALLLCAPVALSTSIQPRLDRNGVVPRQTNNTAETDAGSILPGAYIVEFADDNETPSSFYASIAATGVHLEPRMDLSFRFFKGVSFQVKPSSANSSAIDNRNFLRQMQSTPQIRNIWPSRIIQRTPDMDFAVGAQNTHIKRQTQGEERIFSPHVLTQVDKLHAEGVTGKGFRIAVVDSGIDYTHPALGGCFGPGCLVEVGYDFVGDNYVPGSRPPVPDDDPMDNCEGHGTHVAGIIAAQLKGNQYGFTGSAPGAKLGAYRMWGCPAASTTEIEVLAFARAVEDGADIISYSNGDRSSWTEDLRATIVSRIVDSGIPVIVSEGNDGAQGLFYASTPAVGNSVTGVGAVTNTKFPIFLEQGSYTTQANSSKNDTVDFGFLMGTPAFAAKTTLPLWSAVDANNACNPLPDDTPDLSQKIVLLEFPDSRATQCYPPDQGANIAAKGGRFMLYFDKNNLTMDDDPFVYVDAIEGVARVVPYHAERWLSLLSQGTPVTVSITNGSATHLEELENNISGGYMASRFTSWGPSWELNMTPQFASPGEYILSTYPTALGSYAVVSGTSMSTPLVAGVYAMLGEVYGKLDPKRLRRILTHTSKPLAWFDRKQVHPDILAPVPQQGAGVLQAWDAAHTTIELDTDSLMLNDTEHFVGTHTFSISNTGSEAQVLKLDHRKAVTMYTMDPKSATLQAGFFPNTIVTSYATVSFSSDSITVAAGQSAQVTVTFTPPADLNATLLPVYSGYVTIGDKLVLPYMGVAGSMRATPVISPGVVYLADGYSPAPANTTYTITRPDPANPPTKYTSDITTTPNVYIKPIVGTPLVRVDVLQGGTELGALAGWPQPFIGRSEERAWFHGLLDNGSVLEEGTYRLRVRALRIFGDEKRDEDWDVVETVPVSIKYKA